MEQHILFSFYSRPLPPFIFEEEKYTLWSDGRLEIDKGLFAPIDQIINRKKKPKIDKDIVEKVSLFITEHQKEINSGYSCLRTICKSSSR